MSLEIIGFATLGWVNRFNNRRLSEAVGSFPLTEAEAGCRVSHWEAGLAA